MKMIGSVSCFSSLILPVFSCCAVFCVFSTSRPKQAICAGRRKKAAKGGEKAGKDNKILWKGTEDERDGQEGWGRGRS